MYGSDKLVSQFDDVSDDAGRWAWLPDEAVLEMPRQTVDQDAPAIRAVLETSPADVDRRRLIPTVATAVTALLAAIAPFILYARKGFDCNDCEIDEKTGEMRPRL